MYNDIKQIKTKKKRRIFMAFDGFTARAVTLEINKNLSGERIEKIYQPEKDEIIISFRTKNGPFKLLLSASPSNARVHLTEKKHENPTVAPLFCMILRKHLQGGRLIAAEQHLFDRVITLKIESYTELGDLTEKRLVIEIMGRCSNIILVSDKNTVIDCIRHVDLTQSSVRQLLPGLFYSLPPEQNKLLPNEIDKKILSDALSGFDKNSPYEKFLLSTVMGISPLAAHEIVFRAYKQTDVLICQKDPKSFIDAACEVFENISSGEFHPCVIYEKGIKRPAEFSCIRLFGHQAFEEEVFDGISAAVDRFYEKRAEDERIKQKSASVTKLLTNNIQRCRKKIAIHEKNLEKAKKRDKYKMYGDLITANIYRIKYGDKVARVENFYSESLETVDIPLKENISPAQNAQSYYKLFSKAKATEEHSKTELKGAKDELYYLESVLEALSLSKNAEDINEIKEELFEQGYITRQKNQKNKKKPAKASPLEFKTDDGYTVFVGRNNKENDFLTLKSSYSTDIWLHTKIIPGSHTVIKTGGDPNVPPNTIYQAAALAAYHSKAKGSAQVPVDYTTVKNVKKPNGAKPGLVIYDNYNTVYISPDEELVEKLKNNAKN